MKWMRERDLLIAQTMAFVQSVTGKKPDAEAVRESADAGRRRSIGACRRAPAVAPAAVVPDIEATAGRTTTSAVEPPKPVRIARARYPG